MVPELAREYVSYPCALDINERQDDIYAEHLHDVRCAKTKELKSLEL